MPPMKPPVPPTNQSIAHASADRGLLHMMLPWGLEAQSGGVSAARCMTLTVPS